MEYLQQHPALVEVIEDHINVYVPCVKDTGEWKEAKNNQWAINLLLEDEAHRITYSTS